MRQKKIIITGADRKKNCSATKQAKDQRQSLQLLDNGRLVAVVQHQIDTGNLVVGVYAMDARNIFSIHIRIECGSVKCHSLQYVLQCAEGLKLKAGSTVPGKTCRQRWRVPQSDYRKNIPENISQRYLTRRTAGRYLISQQRCATHVKKKTKSKTTVPST